MRKNDDERKRELILKKKRVKFETIQKFNLDNYSMRNKSN